MMNAELSIQDEINYLANAMSDEQRKAMFAKMGGSGSSGGNRQVYTRAGTSGGSASGSGSSGSNNPSPPRTVQTMGPANQRTTSWVTSLSPDQMKQEYENDPDRLRAAIEDQLRAGAYDGIQVNGHAPSVDDIINNGIAPNYAAPARVLSAEESAKAMDPLGGAQAVALDSMTGKPLQEGVGSWAHLNPVEQAKQDVSKSTISSGGASSGGSSSDGGSSSGSSDSVSLPDAIDNLPSGGDSDGGSGGGSAALNYLQDFLDALALAHF